MLIVILIDYMHLLIVETAAKNKLSLEAFIDNFSQDNGADNYVAFLVRLIVVFHE